MLSCNCFPHIICIAKRCCVCPQVWRPRPLVVCVRHLQVLAGCSEIFALLGLTNLGSLQIHSFSSLFTMTMLLVQSVGSVTRAMWPSASCLSSCAFTVNFIATGTLRGAHWIGQILASSSKCTSSGTDSAHWKHCCTCSSPVLWSKGQSAGALFCEAQQEQCCASVPSAYMWSLTRGVFDWPPQFQTQACVSIHVLHFFWKVPVTSSAHLNTASVSCHLVRVRL